MVLMRPETSRAIITHLCGMDIFTLQITGLRCFCKYWEELPILSNEESRPVESFIVKVCDSLRKFVFDSNLASEGQRMQTVRLEIDFIQSIRRCC